MIIVGYLLMFVISLTTGINPDADKVGFKIGEVLIPVTFIFTGLTGACAFFGQTLFYQVLTISVANTVEYNEYTTGMRDEGVIFACRPFTAKLGSAAVVGITTLVVLALGLNPTNKAISNADYEAGQLAVQVEQLVKDETPTPFQRKSRRNLSRQRKSPSKPKTSQKSKTLFTQTKTRRSQNGNIRQCLRS